MFWRARHKKSSPAPQSAPAPPTLRVMDPKEIAIHVVEAMRDGPRYWLTRDMESVAKAWYAENNVEPVQLCYLRAAVQTTPGVRYAKLNLKGPQFGPIRRALQSRGMQTEKQFIYEIAPQVRASSVPGPAQFYPVPAQSGTRQNSTDWTGTRTELGGNYRKTRAA